MINVETDVSPPEVGLTELHLRQREHATGTIAWWSIERRRRRLAAMGSFGLIGAAAEETAQSKRKEKKSHGSLEASIDPRSRGLCKQGKTESERIDDEVVVRLDDWSRHRLHRCVELGEVHEL